MVKHQYKIKDDNYVCSKCGHIFGPGESYFDTCKVEIKEEIKELETPSTLKKLMNFSSAFSSHVLDGMQKCTQEEIDARMNTCKECPFYRTNGENGECLKCGCNLTRKQVFFNKLAWKSSECPIGKWEKL